MQNLIYILILVFFLFINFLLFNYYKNFAYKFNFLDKPNKLSNHNKKIPTGAGIIFIFLISTIHIGLFISSEINLIELNFPNRHYLFLIAIISLGIISFIDDIKSVHFLYRFVAHIIFVMASTPLFSYDIIYLIPEKLSLMIIIFMWVYIINVFNFLDGSNGYMSINAIFILISYLITLVNSSGYLLDFNFFIICFTLLILIIYLFFNFPKASIFCGDSGSIVVGYIIGFIFFDLITNNYWYVAVAALSYPLIDVTLTIIKKVRNGKYPWERLFDYHFLKALNATNKNHKKIFTISFIFNSINLLIITLSILNELKWLFLFSIILAFYKIFYFSNLSKER